MGVYMIENNKLPRYKNEIEAAYGTILSPLATKVPRPDSRQYKEDINDYDNRSSFQRDRDRIIHCKAFRGLMYKTQVFVNHEGDFFRTRLTHTLEVAQLARGVCKSLALNEDLAEAIALGHDLGHTPFGHAVEDFLNQKLQQEERKKNKVIGTFYHNEQGVRVVDFLERRCDEYPGLNLTYEVREGILKHNNDRSGIYQSLKPESICSTLEGQIVYWVDTIGYICHDLQDGIMSGLIDQALSTNQEFKEDYEQIRFMIGEFLQADLDQIDLSRYSKTYFIDRLIHYFIMDLTNNSVSNIQQLKVENTDDVKRLAEQGQSIIGLSEKTAVQFKQFRKLIYRSVYGLHSIRLMDYKAEEVVRSIYEALAGQPELLPPDWLSRYHHAKVDLQYDGAAYCEERVICDYIACMTDRSALDEYDRLFNPRIKINRGSHE